MNPRLRLFALAALALAPLASIAAEPASHAAPAAQPAPAIKPKFGVGADAPALTVRKWVQGERVAAYEPGKVYLIECWATWCGPCLAQIPHLNELHKKYAGKGLVVTGVAVWEGKRFSEIGEFVKKKGDGMSYRVAYDGMEGPFAKAWLEPLEQRSIPHAFVVRDGIILWRGHPANLSEATLESMMAGQYTPVPEPVKPALPPAELLRREKQRKERDLMTEATNLLVDGKNDASLAKLAEAEKISGATNFEFRHMVFADKGDADAALKNFADWAGSEKSPLYLAYLADLMLDAPVFESRRDLPLARKCLAAARVGAPDDLYVGVIEARFDHVEGRKDAALAKLEAIKADPKSRGVSARASAILDVLKAGKPWPESPGMSAARLRELHKRDRAAKAEAEAESVE